MLHTISKFAPNMGLETGGDRGGFAQHAQVSQCNAGKECQHPGEGRLRVVQKREPDGIDT